MQRSGGKSVEGVRTGETALHIHMWRICNAERQTAVCGDGLASSNVQFSEYHAHTHTHTYTERDLPIAKRSGRLRMKAKSSVAQPRYYVLDRRFSRLRLLSM